ncbi:rhodanese-like domain-containing protein 14, chloroplastic [Humulus lupulus]|uniref:rhodanese-like domain-containing protein 14, chloroplastic n=1 Tax=Humulus lupulus TaxID=3486 RepID=UPI002B41509C|nr:rhodanese-like domain-containing protein 14, chloroplastic [Humulus lupulus]
MASLTSLTSYPSSSSLQSNFQHSPLMLASKHSQNNHNSSRLMLGVLRSTNNGLSPQTSPQRLKIQSAATKPAKRPAEEDWKIKREKLLEKRVRSVDAKEAFRLQKENNFVILDVRPEADFKEAHPPGAINVQIYRLIKEWTAWDIARRAAFAFFGIFAGTEENPEFIPIVESNIKKDAKIIVACSTGGTMKPTQNLPEGQQSRSLIAAYLLVLNGYANVYHLEGGLYAWSKEDLPITSEEEE